MRLEPGLTLRIAPRFHVEVDWSARLSLNGGAAADARGNRFPHDDWRLPTAGELQILLEAGPHGTAHIDLFAIPAALRQRWWDLTASDDPAGFDRFVAELLELLRFKRLPVPARCGATVVVSRPGQTSTRVDGTPAMPIAVINLGDERTHVVSVNSVACVADGYPLLRIALEPGDGLWLPSQPPVFDGWTVGKRDLDAMLVLHE